MTNRIKINLIPRSTPINVQIGYTKPAPSIIHNSLMERDALESHPASAISYGEESSVEAELTILGSIREENTMSLVVETRTDDPIDPVEGRIWLRTDL